MRSHMYMRYKPLACTNEPNLSAPVLTPAFLISDLEPLPDCARYDDRCVMDVL